jgi:hypothetical protein
MTFVVAGLCVTIAWGQHVNYVFGQDRSFMGEELNNITTQAISANFSKTYTFNVSQQLQYLLIYNYTETNQARFSILSINLGLL